MDAHVVATVSDAMKLKDFITQIHDQAIITMDSITFGDDCTVKVGGRGVGTWLRSVADMAEQYQRACQGHIDAVLTQSMSNTLEVNQ